MTMLDDIERIIALYPFAAFGAVFLAGVLSSASPCVLTTIPLVVGFTGGYADGDRMKAFRYSLFFVFGLSLTFTAFGAAAGLLGTMFGTLGGKWYLIAGTIALLMGLQMMEMYRFELPWRTEWRPRQAGLFGAFILGLFFGIVSSPCATPVLVVLLTLVASKAQVLYGIALLFCYAIGHCLLMLFAGTCTGFVESFAKSKGIQGLSTWAKRFSGAIVAIAGGWFVWQGLASLL
ncbi:cytochrome c biogenesis protein CcdA [Geomonas terrae]|uniref:Cytochrome c biogenesis protein CcdA n=1 Tax=Geomonas terrae TaxID=2562681 RepID=A0A4S1CIF7_9BACT|nr:cytochrome c biogenesis protein CcdA [Geomonas terrae]TGU70516.1 cytochrome c biogenesis protein CcdA [Geomonas terrae]TGU72936.1 cytochrome c biogenesis protein CcdA [Geomonas terrae]